LKPGHIIGYEHTFIAALGDFLRSLKAAALPSEFRGWPAVEQVLAAVEACRSRTEFSARLNSAEAFSKQVSVKPV
jgi:hypothetical protein